MSKVIQKKYKDISTSVATNKPVSKPGFSSLGSTMLRLFCAAAAFFAVTSVASAEDYCDILQPCNIPVKFTQGQYRATPVIKEIPYRALQVRCGTSHYAAGNGALGCTIFNANECHVYLPAEFKKKLPDLFVLIREHELAHCRGWRH